MRLLTFELPTSLGPVQRIGALTPVNEIVDLTLANRLKLMDGGMTESAAIRISEAETPPDMIAFIEGGGRALESGCDALDWAQRTRQIDGYKFLHLPGEVSIRSPIPRPPVLRDFMAFETHLQNIYPKLGRTIPPEWYNLPVYYKGNPGSVGADGEDIRIPVYATELDYEFELAIVIARGGTDIKPANAMDHIYGYMIYNDLSAREIQQREMSVGLGPAKGKDFHRAHVLGPYLVTADEISDPYNLDLRAYINGEECCSTNTSTIHWSFEDMIAHASKEETLVAGEVFGTGTVGGGSGTETGRLLSAGDVIELKAEKLGVLSNRIIKQEGTT